MDIPADRCAVRLMGRLYFLHRDVLEAICPHGLIFHKETTPDDGEFDLYDLPGLAKKHLIAAMAGYNLHDCGSSDLDAVSVKAMSTWLSEHVKAASQSAAGPSGWPCEEPEAPMRVIAAQGKGLPFAVGEFKVQVASVAYSEVYHAQPRGAENRDFGQIIVRYQDVRKIRDGGPSCDELEWTEEFRFSPKDRRWQTPETGRRWSALCETAGIRVGVERYEAPSAYKLATLSEGVTLRILVRALESEDEDGGIAQQITLLGTSYEDWQP